MANPSELPTCNSGDRINLLSYKYIGYICSHSNQCIRKEYNVSQAAEVLIHEMCSSRDTCISRNLPLSDLSARKVDTLHVEYQCLDHFETFLDMCVDTTKTLDSTVHLVTSKTLRTSQECKCSFRGDEFTVILKDIRLLADSKDLCSPAKLKIPFRQITCNNQSTNYGSVFDKITEDLTAMSNVRIQTFSTELFPQSVWIIIQPKGSLTVACESTPWKMETTSTNDYTTDSPYSSSGGDILNSTEGDRGNDSNNKEKGTLTAGIVVGVFMCVVLVGGASFAFRRFGPCNTKTRENDLELQDEQRRVKHHKDTETVTWSTNSERWQGDAATPLLNRDVNCCEVTRILQDANDTASSLDSKVEHFMDEVACINPRLMYNVACINTKIRRKQKYQEVYDVIKTVIITRRLHKSTVLNFPV